MSVIAHITEGSVSCMKHAPVLVHFVKRSLLCAGQDDTVILPYKTNADEYLWLRQQGFGPGEIVYVNDKIPYVLCEQGVHPFSGCSQRVWDMAQGQVISPSREICLSANHKGILQEWLNQKEISPLGFHAMTPGDVEKAMDLVQERCGNKTPCIIKPTHSASGLLQQCALTFEEVDTKILAQDSFVVQECVQKDGDLSIQCEVNADGTGIVKAITRQIIDNLGSHQGNIFPVPMSNTVQKKLHALAQLTFELAHSLEYFGRWCIDVMYSGDLHSQSGAVKFSIAEINARVTAPFYPELAALKRFGKVKPFVMQSINIQPLMTFESLLKSLEGLTFDAQKEIGVIPFCFLPAFGKVVLLAYANSLDDAQQIWKDAYKALSWTLSF